MQHLLSRDAQHISGTPGILDHTMTLIVFAPLYLIIVVQEM
jgi:hypothetical protein